ncbi:MAG: UvrB/UvrC motif-containing protein, partial [Phycisphaerae bacterium]|nr:UvrB/UvrC motif-containing protein [Phycisphaerae bacterium]
ELAELSCPQCGLSFLEFRQHGLLGCPNDYEVFEQPLDGLLTRVHGEDTHHVGKVPARGGTQQKRNMKLLRLRRELAGAVESEEYEKAAELRDRIKEFEKQ